MARCLVLVWGEGRMRKTQKPLKGMPYYKGKGKPATSKTWRKSLRGAGEKDNSS